MALNEGVCERLVLVTVCTGPHTLNTFNVYCGPFNCDRIVKFGLESSGKEVAYNWEMLPARLEPSSPCRPTYGTGANRNAPQHPSHAHF